MLGTTTHPDAERIRARLRETAAVGVATSPAGQSALAR